MSFVLYVRCWGVWQRLALAVCARLDSRQMGRRLEQPRPSIVASVLRDVSVDTPGDIQGTVG
jgi:hypothetical protein